MSTSQPLSREEVAHLQQLVRDLVQGDANLPSGTDSGDGFDQIPYIIKQIFQTGRQDAFTDQLSHYITRKQGEIEKICNLHYQEFVQSVDQLLKVRAGTATMRDKIVHMNQDLQYTGAKMVEKKAELIENQKILLNIENSIEAIQLCLFVFDICNRIVTQVSNAKYYSALRMLDELHKVHVKLISPYTFSELVQHWIPMMENKILDAVLDDMKQWFVDVKENTGTVGKLAMELTAMRQKRATEILANNGHASSRNSSLNIGTSMELAINEEYDLDALDNDNVRIDFTSLFQCIHIHDVLGKRTQFKLQYDENRRVQSDIILTSQLSLKDGDFSAFERYIQEVAGFFVIEATVISCTDDFRSRVSVDALWETATNKMNIHISESLRDCNDPELFVKIKLAVVSFIQTMEIYGFPVTSLTDVMVSLLDRYAELVKSEFSDVFFSIVEEDDNNPLILQNQQELDAILMVFHIPDELIRTPNRLGRPGESVVIFPKPLPFSKSLPRCCDVVYQFINRFYQFADGFAQQNNEMDDLLKKSLENLLVQNLNGALMRKMATGSLSGVIQIMVNLQYFELACLQFEAFLQERRTTYKGVRVALQATQSFEDSRIVAEKRLYEIINTKIDDFLEVADYNWESVNASSSPSPYLNDLVEYITTVVSSTLATLPPTTKNLIYFEAFDHLTSSFKGYLLDPMIKRLTVSAIQTLDVDVAFLEQFIRRLPDVSAGDAFTELRQLINYAKSENYEDILAPSIRNKKYSRVEMGDILIILEKLKNFDTSYFSKATAQERKMKQTIEGVIKTLRSQM